MAKQKLDPDPLLNSRMKRHLKSLEVKNIGEYRSWCISEGLRPTLSKNISQLEAEIRAKKSSEKIAAAHEGLQEHVKALELADVAGYRAWCRNNHLNESLHKSKVQRRKEIQIKIRADFNKSHLTHYDTRGNIETTIKAISSGELPRENLTNPALQHVYELIHDGDIRDDSRKLFVRLLVAVLPKANFLDMNPAIQGFGRAKGNTLIDALFALTGHSDQWIRAPESWAPEHRSLQKRFSELARHLFTLYAVPVFMDTAWFAGAAATAVDQQRWFIHVGHGGNIRTAGLPLHYTKRMAHVFLQAPDTYSVIGAIRWGQILAIGGTKDLVGHINATALGNSLAYDEFWISVLHFFVNNPMLDRTHIGPIIDYISHRKFEVQEVELADGTHEAGPPPDPNFTMKGRRPGPLLELVDAWHLRITREQKSRAGSWTGSGFPPFEHVEEDVESGGMISWTITELLTRKEVFDEGRAMKHCVGSYVPSCIKGIKSVWSLKCESANGKTTRRVLTIAVKNDTRVVVQARGKCNAMAGIRTNSRQQAQVMKREEQLLENGRRIMRQWGNANDITVPHYT